MASVYARFKGLLGWEYQRVGRGRPPKDAKFSKQEEATCGGAGSQFAAMTKSSSGSEKEKIVRSTPATD